MGQVINSGAVAKQSTEKRRAESKENKEALLVKPMGSSVRFGLAALIGVLLLIIIGVTFWTFNWPGDNSTFASSSTTSNTPLIMNPSTFNTPTGTTVSTTSGTPIEPSITDWPLGNLIIHEDFEHLPIQGWNIRAGNFQRISDENGNHVWQTSTNSQALLTLPISGGDYAMEARVMQVSGGQALPMLDVRFTEGGPCDAGYRTYFDTFSGWLTLVEYGLTASGTCDELRVGGTGLIATRRIALSNNTWYKVRIEAKGPEIRVYLNDQFMLHGTSNSLDSNYVGISSWSDSSQFTFDFDDIKIWILAP